MKIYEKISVMDDHAINYPTILKGCRGVGFTHGVLMGVRAVGQAGGGLYFGNYKV